MFDKKEVIEKLKLEIAMVERGGYNPSVREPRKLPQIFRDSVTCLNYGLEVKKEPCIHCFLIEYVPPERRSESEPCHFIPLNSKGDTIISLQHDPVRLQAALLGWLYKRLAELEKEVAREDQAANR